MLWAVAIGSAAGGCCRYLLSRLLNRPGELLPWGTLAINVAGSFLLGLILRYALDRPDFSPVLRTGLLAGFCGGFTTFSSFSGETFELLERGLWAPAAGYAAASVLLCLGATALGAALGRAVAA
ncbi:MAG: fluoride efflux transporter CrcB [Gemmatimonadales bacterium]|nr:fluoride efflux transporter CrcB [Gemmatimonadales bacterium]